MALADINRQRECEVFLSLWRKGWTGEEENGGVLLNSFRFADDIIILFSLHHVLVKARVGNHRMKVEDSSRRGAHLKLANEIDS